LRGSVLGVGDQSDCEQGLRPSLPPRRPDKQALRLRRRRGNTLGRLRLRGANASLAHPGPRRRSCRRPIDHMPGDRGCHAAASRQPVGLLRHRGAATGGARSEVHARAPPLAVPLRQRPIGAGRGARRCGVV
ncbi:MAG: hypothetical protein AVDCRST_MAG19-2050, partial [uncultured Thermomicrobiales bacterium]